MRQYGAGDARAATRLKMRQESYVIDLPSHATLWDEGNVVHGRGGA